jgi:hypothetical protein
MRKCGFNSVRINGLDLFRVIERDKEAVYNQAAQIYAEAYKKMSS